jgi:hypothetical protein
VAPEVLEGKPSSFEMDCWYVEEDGRGKERMRGGRGRGQEDGEDGVRGRVERTREG